MMPLVCEDPYMARRTINDVFHRLDICPTPWAGYHPSTTTTTTMIGGGSSTSSSTTGGGGGGGESGNIHCHMWKQVVRDGGR